mmetsp:Transcript_67232/g.133243  ORF Transcript_67232/g.133243 Transcript_67232/m.133243 type:complete len:216 (+) Transcript_67232:589-1236(+)
MSLVMPAERRLAPAPLMNAGPEEYSSHWRHSSRAKLPVLAEWMNLAQQWPTQRDASLRMLSTQMSMQLGRLVGSCHARPSSLKVMPLLTRQRLRSASDCLWNSLFWERTKVVEHAVMSEVMVSLVDSRMERSCGLLQAEHSPQCRIRSPAASTAAFHPRHAAFASASSPSLAQAACTSGGSSTLCGTVAPLASMHTHGVVYSSDQVLLSNGFAFG